MGRCSASTTGCRRRSDGSGADHTPRAQRRDLVGAGGAAAGHPQGAAGPAPELLYQARRAQSLTYNPTLIVIAAVIYFLTLWPVVKGREGAEWTGIRNFSARNHLRAMKKGEQAFFYHTGKERAIVGIVRVIAEAHPDSTDSAWDAIDVAAVKKLPTPVTASGGGRPDHHLQVISLTRRFRLESSSATYAEDEVVIDGHRVSRNENERVGGERGQHRRPISIAARSS